MNNKHASYKDTRGIYQKNKNVNSRKKRQRVFLMLSNNVDYCIFLIEEFNQPAAST